MSHFACPSCGAELSVSRVKRGFDYDDIDPLAGTLRRYLSEREGGVRVMPAQLFADARTWAAAQNIDLPGDPKLSAAFAAAGCVRKRSSGKRWFELP